MSKGLGKQYFVRMVKHIEGTLEECIKFMQENKPISDKYWYELFPRPKVKSKQITVCDQYSCSLVCDSHLNDFPEGELI